MGELIDITDHLISRGKKDAVKVFDAGDVISDTDAKALPVGSVIEYAWGHEDEQVIIPWTNLGHGWFCANSTITFDEPRHTIQNGQWRVLRYGK